MKKFIFSLVFIASVFYGCANKNLDNPADVVKEFILLCEKGDINKAQQLLEKNNNVDYFRKFKDLNGGKDLFYIDYDYKGNDDTVELKFENLKDLSSASVAVVKLTSNYKKQQHSFEKNIVLHKINGEWKIYDFLFMPVKVK
ncbi:DUF4878 domain-containing protein [Campylobacter geochelonis]|uniref:Uncharacterized protein n=1 Tax=Campylobacter geochelonis TaxID=1780362 RepID=A0A128EFQ5_9BACT|nr:DUF4878 domain-containing protein [Campylobacter geochelonis]QKF70952.1 hypothetical protein CGEO_0631 [Campylobacter geochelonis]CZE47023.1 Uncharacterised protein [Campylobacter geochelonis]CZE47519.1 Uncharacterised protein [Campylobacter geochelonis]CZE50232.1 Uncharacterised protein [Campylobacter geochelonis]